MAERLISLLAGLALCLALPFAAQPVQAQEEGWQSELTAQMARDYDCEVAFFSQVVEREVNGDLVILAKVHCLDKRTFDAYRDSAFQPFEIHPCENPENRAC
ncbi:hypothetical protein [Pelagibius marinus]|uniref:hypothetical protein n=1 Tax=Pelagibius marinus TaxID=2762760 RepID=UPI001872B45A|nr:hypothetical protein [Pelagibius marinus]